MPEKEKSDEVIHFLERGVLISPDVIPDLGYLDKKPIFEFFENNDLLYFSKDLLPVLESKLKRGINWTEFEKLKAKFEKDGKEEAYKKFLDYVLLGKEQEQEDIKIIASYEETSAKREMADFAMYFNSRLNMLQKILYSRGQLKGMTSIGRILDKKERANISLIGLVKEKRTTKNGNIIIKMEDNTGEINVLVNKNKPDIFELARDIVLDEVIGISGVNGDNIVFANNLLLPDIPNTNQLKKSNQEGYAIFLSDLHVGSNNFLEQDFNKFLKWINRETGNEKQKEIASKVKYIFILGDLVDGVGVYPGQENELTINDIYEQYEKCAGFLSKIPDNIKLIICAGNHDALRLAEPQPPLYTDFCKKLHELPNTILVSNPAMINIHASGDFPGYNVLLYHGYSFDYYVANVDSIRNGGGYDRADLIMKFLLRRRHLAPTHASTLYVPYQDQDPLVIDTIPDFFVTGHIHKTSVANYKNVTLISGSCWQSKTSFQAKMGHHPEPSRVPIVNLATRDVKVLKFGK
ncbi:DNA-directed DNA polymerase II small subunit [Candidatus Woesearchaeota archaeon]|nr:DNA-directed DNA polymerase II small subunit [Candidatus Woesearchaeota archaeon]